MIVGFWLLDFGCSFGCLVLVIFIVTAIIRRLNRWFVWIFLSASLGDWWRLGREREERAEMKLVDVM